MTNERELLDRMQRGDQLAFNEFFDSNASRIAAFAARRSTLDAASLEDIVQQTMIKAIRNLAGFRGESSLFTWLCSICRSQLADSRRKAARQPHLENLDSDAMDQSRKTPVSLIDFRDPMDECLADSSRSEVRRAVNGLSSRYSRILELRYGDDLTVPEIARVLQLTEDAAESLLVRAKRAFRDRWVETQLPGEAGLWKPAP
ncbi:MAG: RNA polymerase sigma factor [Pseudomonadota bacterium]